MKLEIEFSPEYLTHLTTLAQRRGVSLEVLTWGAIARAYPIGEAESLEDRASAILSFLNEKTGRRYRDVAVNLTFIVARLKSGVTADQCRQVIARKCRDWIGDAVMEPYLRPATLFNATKFEQYLGELGQAKGKLHAVPSMQKSG